MSGKIKERCIYCGGDVYYDNDITLIKCEWCGHTLVTTRFEREIRRLEDAEKARKEAEQALREAKEEKQQADQRLFKAVSALDEIRVSQQLSQQQIEKQIELASASLEEDKEAHAAVTSLLRVIGSGLADGQETLGRLMLTLSSDQEEFDGKLMILRETAAKILESQEDVFSQMGVMNEIAAHLLQMEMDAKERQHLMQNFMAWCQNVQQEDLERLTQVQDSAGVLLRRQEETSAKVDALQSAAEQAQKTLDAFHREWKKSQLEEIQRLYHQAENFQHDWQFDKAAEYYREVVTKGGGDAEICWRLLLCHYCVTYQRDEEGRMIPIILNPDLSDPAEMSLRQELKNHIDPEQKEIYGAELARIDQILEKYRLVRDQVKYDVFLSVKQNRDGHYTSDSDVAADLYDFLTDQGLKVFNSRRTIIPAGQEYEPYIIAALMSAQALIVVGTCAENMKSQWVKNEWSRFQWLQKDEKKLRGKSDRLLLCYLAKGMQPDQIPKGLDPNRQAVLDGVKAHDQLLESLKPLLAGKSQKTERHPDIMAEPEGDASQVLNQMTVWLALGEFEPVADKYKELKDKGLYLNEPMLHLFALCAQKKVPEPEQLVPSGVELEKEPLYRLALKMCRNPEEKLEIKKLLKKNAPKDPAGSADQEKNPETPAPPTAGELLEKAAAAEQAGRLAEAVSFFREAAKLGNAKAQNDLGYYLETGRGTYGLENKREAFRWYREAALQQYASGMYNTARCLERGIGTKKNVKEAVSWYRKAAQAGNIQAKYNLAVCLTKGTGTEKDMKEAVSWYREAAESGLKQAQYNLAVCLEYGLGTEKDEEAARIWYQKADVQ